MIAQAKFCRITRIVRRVIASASAAAPQAGAEQHQVGLQLRGIRAAAHRERRVGPRQHRRVVQP